MRFCQRGFMPTLKLFFLHFFIQRLLHKGLMMLCLFLFLSFFARAQLTANFTSDKTTGCTPALISFINQSTGTSPTTTYEWDFGTGGPTSFEINPRATFFTPGTFTITLTARDGAQVSTITKQRIHHTPQW
jgi:hypothetical protein